MKRVSKSFTTVRHSLYRSLSTSSREVKMSFESCHARKTRKLRVQRVQNYISLCMPRTTSYLARIRGTLTRTGAGKPLKSHLPADDWVRVPPGSTHVTCNLGSTWIFQASTANLLVSGFAFPDAR
ncbi:hypothetical protein CY34DRAFT_806189 [Suillus luteus UH-Slu-Lm8-n1]|uniref:Uncharacterized protein n=1 Tax=Suillus luteus UH-Slu-Lm8-n1 TaxID=930992 RepID=A0A0C9ZTQ3_9AGAM|nr:hypothetical protein CY34DRAFT_806189 [Suillus luteus UH-Slu-Lm8-n1]